MKVLINLSVPAIAEEYDLFLPVSLKAEVVIPLIAKTIEGLSNHRYVQSGCEKLCILENKTLIKNNTVLAEYGIRNGDHLILF